MNFFERQYRARRRTAFLTACFLLAVVLIVAVVNAVVYWAAAAGWSSHAAGPLELHAWLEQPYWIWTSAAVIAVVALGSLRSFVRLRGGGQAVAAMVGARRIDMGSTAAGERRLINVVEEMSIASGTPVPVLYVMDDEAAINAFVAGYRPDQAVLVVTRGALEALDRDQLQGVVGHEYSHILNGDMRLNVRLLSTLAGILLIGQLGGFLLRSLRYAGGGRSRGSGQAVAAMLAVGLALFAVGYVGLFCGRLIKAAIARQRELLADASSVQFTRNPHGIAGALWKIGRHEQGAILHSRHAEDMNHMCFGDSVRLRFGALLATHPPIEARIKAIDPAFLARKRVEARAGIGPAREGAPASAPPAAPAPAAGLGFAAGTPASTAALADSVGNPTPRHMAYAAQLHAALPPALLDAAHSPLQARALVYALVLAQTGEGARAAASAALAERADPAVAARARELLATIAPLGATVRLPLLNLALPVLQSLDLPVRTRFLDGVRALVRSDRHTTLFELVLLVLLDKYLDPASARADRIVHTRYAPVLEHVRTLLSAFARAGHPDEARAQAALAQVMRPFDARRLHIVPAGECTAGRIALALRKLDGLSPFLKRSLLNACTDCVLHDGRILAAEAELLRATAAALDCPMPPLLEP